VEHLFADDPWAPGLTVTNARGVYAVPIGQYVLAEILRINERVDARRALQESRRWPTDDEADLLVGRQLRGQVIVVVGYGGVGREVARLAAALGMRVIAVKSRPGQRAEDGFRVPGTGDPSGSIPERIVGLEALTEVVRLADVVVLTAPLTDRTRGLFDRQLIGAIRPDAWFINVGRGAIVDEPALVEALRERRIGGAVLDVFVEEPLPPESPFWTLPNTLVTPHVSGADAAAGELVADLFEENLRRYAAGELLLNVVDPARQY
jgi:phosphoglycerate dehydrogenase-like enzyme